MDSFVSDDIAQWLLPLPTVDEWLDSLPEDAFQISDHASTSATVIDTSPTPKQSRKQRRFAPVKTESEIQLAREQGIPLKTQADTKYCLNLWNEWRKYRYDKTGDVIKPLVDLDHTELEHWLIRFILEVRKKNGSEFPANSVHHICCGLMRHLRWNGQATIDFFKDEQFVNFRASLDSEMKRLQSNGTGLKKRQAEVLTEDEEDLLWKKGLLGDKTPQALLNTIIFYNGLYFALRSGKEHRQLRSDPCQIEVIERPGERSYLKYCEDISKNRPGGLKGRKIQPKTVLHHSNAENPERCFVRLFKQYVVLCPETKPANAFYMQPAANPSEKCWFSNRPIGHSALSKTVARLCKEAGIPGYKTNHSLRATAATRLYQSGVDEQLVMERTGHRSLEGVRSYKRTSDIQREALSDILNKRTRYNDSEGTVANSTTTEVPLTTNVQSTMNYSLPGTFNFASCSSVSINIHYCEKKHN